MRLLKGISPHNYCSQSCAAYVNNRKFHKRNGLLQRCANSKCEKYFKRWLQRAYCSDVCYRVAKQEKYDPTLLIRIVQSLAERLGRTPGRRELREPGIEKRCVRLFGSWNAAILAAGLTPNRSHSQRMYKRTPTQAKDGHICDSISEALIDNWLTDHEIAHERDAKYPTTNHKADWCIKGNTFVEYFGLANDSPRYDRAIKEKEGLCQEHGIKLVAIYSRDLYPTVRLESKLGDV